VTKVDSERDVSISGWTLIIFLACMHSMLLCLMPGLWQSNDTLCL
jgi:hypothetical protein